jgi:hypothetical protein
MRAYRILQPQLERADRLCEQRYLLSRHYREDPWRSRVEIKPKDSVTIVIWPDGVFIHRQDKYGSELPWLVLPKDSDGQWHITAVGLRQVIQWLPAITYDDLAAALNLSWLEMKPIRKGEQ